MSKISQLCLIKCCLIAFFCETASAVPTRARIENVDVTLVLPAHFQNQGWTVVSQNVEDDNPRFNTHLEMRCGTWTWDVLGGSGGGISVVAFLKSEKLAEDTFRLTSLDKNEKYHSSKYASGIIDQRGDCSIDLRLNLKNENTGEVTSTRIRKNSGKKWRLSNERLQSLIKDINE